METSRTNAQYRQKKRQIQLFVRDRMNSICPMNFFRTTDTTDTTDTTIWKPGFRQTTSNNSTIARAARTHVQHEHFPHSINHIFFWRLCRRPCLETLHNVSSSLDVYLISCVSHKSDSVHVYFQDEKLHSWGLFLTTAQKSFIYERISHSCVFRLL